MPERAATAPKASAAHRHSGSIKPLAVGDSVLVSKIRAHGTVRFVGKTEFQTGDWVGIELNKPNGKNDGSVQGVRYFECPPHHGLFVHPDMVERKDARKSKAHSTAAAAADAQATPEAASQTESPAPPPRAAAPVMATEPAVADDRGRGHSTYEEGQSVILLGHKGTVRFVGETKFAEGLWLGIELDRPGGSCSGSVQGVEYFQCDHNRGLFVQAPGTNAVWPAVDDAETPKSGNRRPERRRMKTVPMSENDDIVVEDHAIGVIMGPEGPVSVETLIEQLELFEGQINLLEQQLQEARTNEARLKAELEDERASRLQPNARRLAPEFVAPLDAAASRRAAGEVLCRQRSHGDSVQDESGSEAEDLTQYVESY